MPKAKASPKRADKVEDRKAFIKSAAVTLFASNGYEATTMDSLSETTGLNKGTLYYYFASKADILHEICIETISAMLDAVKPAEDEESAVQGLKLVIEQLSRWSIIERDLATVLFQEQAYFKQLFQPEQFKEIRGLQRAFMKTIYSVLSRGWRAANSSNSMSRSQVLSWSARSTLPTIGGQVQSASLTNSSQNI